jgi:hypothetical protein
VKSVEFVSDRMSYLILRNRWYDIVVLNVQVLSKILETVPLHAMEAYGGRGGIAPTHT